MSNDPKQPESGKGKTTPKPSKLSAEINEGDLWDLDGIPAPAAPKPEKTEALPSRRASNPSSRSKRPPEDGVRKAPVPSLGKPLATPTVATSYAEPEYGVPVDSPELAKPADAERGAPAETGGETPAATFSSSLSKTEKIATVSLFAVLALAALLSVIHFSNRVPTRPLLSDEIDFPVSGKLIEVKSAETYWRKPVTSGEDPDVVRRGTALIPVVKLALKSKPGAIRVFFRDEAGVVIGDGISRDVNGDDVMVIAATAGFDDPGMHAAYRTGEKEPWVVQVFEGPNRSADREDFRKVLETEISTDRR